MKKPNVAIFRNSYLPYSETFIYDSIVRYKRFNPIVFAKKRINKDQFQIENLVIPKKLKQSHKRDAFFYSVGIKSTRVAQTFAKYSPTIIHAHFAQSGILAIPYAQRFKTPLIVSLHGNDVGILLGSQKYKPKWWLYAASYRRLIKNTSLFLAGSTELKERFMELGCPADKILVHRLGIDLDSLKKSPLNKPESDSIIVLMVGRLVEKKGFEYGIKAFARVVRKIEAPKMLMKIAGSGPLRQHLENLVSDLDLKANVCFLGKLAHQEVKQILAEEAHILLAPSVIAKNKDRDSGLIVAKEAAACEIPVIGSLHGGIPEIIDDGKTGYLVPERDIEQLANKLESLVADQELMRKLGKAARLKMEKEYDIEQQVAELEAIYEEQIQTLRSQQDRE